jgi:predicted acetyltransferase
MIRNQSGQPVTVGWVTNVATRGSAQRQGHAKQLLQLALVAMRGEGCTWALLSAEEEVAAFYERSGFQRFPYYYRQGLLASTSFATDTPTDKSYATSLFDPLRQPNEWNEIAEVYEIYNRNRPLTVVRGLTYWQEYIAMRFADWQPQLLVATPTLDSPTLSGYAIVLFSEMGVLIGELCIRPTELEAIDSLLKAIHRRLVELKFPEQGRIFAPHEPHLDRVLTQFFDSTLHESYDHFLFARTLAANDEHNDEQRELEATFAAREGILWLLDEY